MARLAAAELFEGMREEDAANRACCDGGSSEASWASVSHGIYLSIGAAGVHRSLGVKVSFVRSTTMDTWSPLHLRMMELGGNRRFCNFLKVHGVPEDLCIVEKYRTRAAQWYRENLRAEAESTPPPQSLPAGTGHLPIEGAAAFVAPAIPESLSGGDIRVRARGSCCKRVCDELMVAAWSLIGRPKGLVDEESDDEGDARAFISSRSITAGTPVRRSECKDARQSRRNGPSTPWC